jgi:uncharacterized membrane protein YbaN (DUF454 family)
LATSYFLANSSQTLHHGFRQLPLFGAMLRDWEELGGWRLTTKLKLFALMTFAWGRILVVAGFSWPMVITLGLASSVSIFTLAGVPTVSARPKPPRLLCVTT